MTDSSTIQQARDVLAKWRSASGRLRPAPWSTAPLWGGMLITDADGAQLNSDDQEDAAEFNGPVAGLIVGTAGNPELLDAIDGILDHAAWVAQGFGSGVASPSADRIAAAIIAADERMTS